jgi:preprotein translocase subunit YajC
MLIFYAQAAAGAAAAQPGDPLGFLGPIGPLMPLILMVIVFYFLVMRPQQRARQQHMQTLNQLKKGDVIVTAGGLIGKVRSVADDEVRVEIASNVEVRVVRSTITEVRSKTDPAPANDTKPSAS